MSIFVFKQLYLGIIVVIECLIENSDSEIHSYRTDYEKPVTDTDFVVSIITVNHVFCITRPCAEQLRQPTCDFVQRYQGIEKAFRCA